MDNLAHSLFGAVVADTGLKRLTPLATATLVIGANLPDIDAVTMLAGGDAALFWRRGVTHGVLALALWPFLLTLVMVGVDRVRRHSRPDATPAHPGWLLALSAIGIWSHTSLDWLNTYGVRWLMPFDGRWFYGDTLFIVDPWVWLLGAAAVVLAGSSTVRGIAGWSVVGLATTGLVLGMPIVPLPSRVLWVAGVAAIVAARCRVRHSPAVMRAARACLAALVVYIAVMGVGTWRARALASAWLHRHGVAFVEVVANPVAANSLVRDVIAVHGDRYSFLRVSWLSGAVTPSRPDVPRGNGEAAIIAAAVSAPGHRGLGNWLRLPAYEVSQEGRRWRVVVRDMRYAQFGRAGLGDAVIEVPQPRGGAASGADPGGAGRD